MHQLCQELPPTAHSAHCRGRMQMCVGRVRQASCLIKTSCKPLRLHPHRVFLVSMLTQLDVFRFTQTGLLWLGHWRWNRPPLAHKHSTTLLALCTACGDDTRGAGLYWVPLRVVFKSAQGSGKAQPARQQRGDRADERQAAQRRSGSV